MDNERIPSLLRELQLFHNYHVSLGNRWVPWFLLGNWLFYAHSRDLLGLISLREMKDYSEAKGVGLLASFLRTQP